MEIFRKLSLIFWRVKVRRLYNQSRYFEAQSLARNKLHDKSESGFARDIIVRSLYNLNDWEGVETFCLQYPSQRYEKYSSRARLKRINKSNFVDVEPERFSGKVWDKEDLLSNWHQEGNRLWLRHKNGWAYWIMPKDFLLSKTHPSLLHLALQVLLSPWNPEVKKWETSTIRAGKKLAVSYSGGIDSTAASFLLPEDTILAYHKRDFESMLTHDMANLVFDKWESEMNREVLVIPSNHERIRTHHGLQVGFSTSNAAGVHLILLADYLDLFGIAFGTPIDNTWLKAGSKYRDFSSSHYLEYWTKQFAKAGLEYVLPINHISEAGAMAIVKQSPISNFVNSCLRGKSNQWCGKCWKCFHKNGPLGREVDPTSKEITTFLNSTPLRTAQHALWALKKQNLEHLAPHLIPHIGSDLSWWEKAYPKGLEIISETLRDGVRERTEMYLPWMEKPYSLESVNLDI
jgi:hypothetical protein